jgi:PspA-Associated protein
MVIRISGEDQYRVDDGERPHIEELEERVAGIVESGAEDGFRDALDTLLQYVRDHGQPVAEDEIEVSDVILPPPDVTFTEATRDFTGEGLIPD